VKVKPEVGEQTITVWLIDWANPDHDEFAIAEEVTVAGENTKRPDIVLYVNGIALGVLELKHSTVSACGVTAVNGDVRVQRTGLGPWTKPLRTRFLNVRLRETPIHAVT